MGCTNCSYDSNGTPKGCGDKGHCSSGSCNKRNTFDWINTLEIDDPLQFNMVEVSFKKGSRKDFFIKKDHHQCDTGDMVLVESSSGYDVGRVSLSGDLVRLQMKKRRLSEDRIQHSVIRRANHRDLQKLEEARALEKDALVKARVIARSLGLDMKVGDVEYQGDKRKATFFYTAEGRVDFRELVKSFAKEFKVKIEMRQIGARQESARIGGIGACGRELCCSTWLSDFKSVNTTAARYQNIAINQTKLSGQCGRLKCCLNYELDAYMDALADFPRKADAIKTKKGKAILIKTNIFKGLLYYSYADPMMRGPMVALSKERVKEIQEMNKNGEFPDELMDIATINKLEEARIEEQEVTFADVTGEIELPDHKKKRRGRNNRNKRKPNNKKDRPNNKDRRKENNGSKEQKDTKGNSGQQNNDPKANTKSKPKSNRNRPNRNNKNNKNNKPKASSDNSPKPQADKNPKPQAKSDQTKNRSEGAEKKSKRPFRRKNRRNNKPNNNSNNENKG